MSPASVSRSKSLLQQEMMETVGQWRMLTAVERARYPQGLRTSLDGLLLDAHTQRQQWAELERLFAEEDRNRRKKGWWSEAGALVVYGSVALLVAEFVHINWGGAGPLPLMVLESEVAVTAGDEVDLVSQPPVPMVHKQDSSQGPLESHSVDHEGMSLLKKMFNTGFFSVAVIGLVMFIEKRVRLPTGGLREFHGWSPLSWPDRFKVLTTFLSAGIIFGFIDNAGLIVGMDTLEEGLKRYVIDDNMVVACVGNMYSDVLGAYLGAYIGSIIMKKSKWDSGRAPLSMQAMGIGIGCLIPIVGRFLYIRHSEASKKRGTAAGEEEHVSGREERIGERTSTWSSQHRSANDEEEWRKGRKQP